MSHPANALDDLAHQRVRLGILAILADARRADFVYLRDTLELTDGNLAGHLQTLAEAGCIETTKELHAGRARTWVSITSEGRRVFDAELDALRAIIRLADAR